MDFNTWLEETKAALAAIAADVAVLGERLSAVEQKTTAYLDEVSHFAEDAKISEGRGSAISRNANVAALIRKSVSMLQHDVEVIIAKD